MGVKSRLGIIIIFITFGLILISDLFNRSETPETFTTNIDIIHKVVNERSNEENNPESLSLLGNIIDAGQKWLSKNLNIWQLYQNLANPYSRYVVLNSGLRKEEIAAILSKELNWNSDERYAFLTTDQIIDKRNMEGYYNPGGYLISNSVEPPTVYKIIMNRFNREVRMRYATSTAEVINMNLAIKIASIIEREAAGAHDMRLISGVIWNRIFKNMNLEMDATLQYAKGSNKNGWWPKVKPEDKYIDSPYNTYKNKGLPPTPISNVSVAAINAALNPKKTACIFYLHDRRGNIHCSVTYKEHQTQIRKYYNNRNP